MQDESKEVQAKAPKAWMKPLIISVSLVAIAALIWNQLPKGTYPTDLSRVGEGRPALVLAYDPNYAGGIAVMDLMNQIRADYTDRIEFLVARFGVPEGRAFANRYQAGDGTVLLFDANGNRVLTLHLPESEEQLRHALDLEFPRVAIR